MLSRDINADLFSVYLIRNIVLLLWYHYINSVIENNKKKTFREKTLRILPY